MRLAFLVGEAQTPVLEYTKLVAVHKISNTKKREESKIQFYRGAQKS